MRLTRGGLVLSGLFSCVVGCTNVAGDAIRVIEVPVERQERLFVSVNGRLTELGYACYPEAEGRRFRCDKTLRDLFVHQTRAVIEVLPDSDTQDTYFVMATRWDEGFIPGELISSEYHSQDVVALCEALEDSGLGQCRMETR